MEEKLSPAALEAALAHFTGSEQFFKAANPLILTEGAMFLAEHARCFWLMDAIASWQYGELSLFDEEFQSWGLTRNPDDTWELQCEDGNGKELAVQHIEHIEFSDFPLDSIALYAVRNELGGFTVMLPSEY